MILQNSVCVQSCGISLASDYTRTERIARNALKLLLQKAFEGNREVKFGGPRLFLDGELCKHDHGSEIFRKTEEIKQKNLRGFKIKSTLTQTQKQKVRGLSNRGSKLENSQR